VGQRRGHLAHGDQARGLLQALLLLQVDLVDVLAVGDVGGDLDAHGAPVHPADGAFVQVIPVAGQGVLDLAVVDQGSSSLPMSCGSRRRPGPGGGDQGRIAAHGIEAVDVLEGAVGEQDLAGLRIGHVPPNPGRR
jgi:hypothetical protein